MLKSIKLLLLSAMTLSFSGCIFHSNPEINYYDINQIPTAVDAQKVPMAGAIQFKLIRNLTPVGNNFIYSGNDGRQFIDRHNLWIQSPEVMIQRKIINSLPLTENNSVIFDISAVLYDFAINQDTRNCTAALKFEVKKVSNSVGKGEVTELFFKATKQAEADNAASYVAAMAQIIDKITLNLQQQLTKF